MRPVLLAGLLAIALSAAPALAHVGAPIPSAHGAATIDGVKSPGEWDAATPRAVFATGLAGSLLYIMDDDINIYVGLFVPDANFQTNDLFWVRFDSKHDGVPMPGDDEINTSSTVFFDSHYDAGGFWGIFDPQRDGSGAAALAPGGAFFEMKHPLNDGDPQDMYANVGDTLGICVFYSNDATIHGTDVYPLGCLEGASQAAYVDYGISHGPLGVEEALAGAARLKIVPDPVRQGMDFAIHYTVPPRGARVDLGIYSITGRKLVDLGDGESEPGEHVLRWTWPDRASGILGPGVYFVRARYDGLGVRSGTLIVQ